MNKPDVINLINKLSGLFFTQNAPKTDENAEVVSPKEKSEVTPDNQTSPSFSVKRITELLKTHDELSKKIDRENLTTDKNTDRRQNQ